MCSSNLEPIDPVGGHASFVDPAADRVAIDAEVADDGLDGHPRFQVGHEQAPITSRPDRRSAAPVGRLTLARSKKTAQSRGGSDCNPSRSLQTGPQGGGTGLNMAGHAGMRGVEPIV